MNTHRNHHRASRGTALLGGLLALAAGPALALDHYVDRGAGVNDPACGDVASPCKTVRHAVEDVAGPGDTLYLVGTTDFRPRGVLVDKDLTIVGLGSGATTLDARAQDRHFRVTSGATLVLRDMTLENGEVGGVCGGSIDVLDARLETDGVVFRDNVADCGGAVWVRGGSLLTDSTEFNGNEAIDGDGGGIFCQNDLAEDCESIEILDSVFNGNASHRDGAAISTGGNTVIRRSDFFENVASFGDGGALYISIYDAGDAEIRRSQFSRNEGNHGGAIAIRDGDVTINRSSLVDNVAQGIGGAVYGYWVGEPDSLTIKNSTVARNGAVTAGGVSAYADGSIYFSTFVDNWANEGQGHDIVGTFALYRSLVTHDVIPATGPECVGVFSGSSNLLDGTTCGSGLGFDLGAHNNTELLGLRLWGGRTLSYGLTSASLAVDAADSCSGPNGLLVRDQRGEDRPAGSGCDIGAWERQ